MEISNVGVVVRPRTEMLLREAHRGRAGDALPARLDGDRAPRHDAAAAVCSRRARRCCSASPAAARRCSSLHFLDAGANKQEPGLYFGFYEPPERLIETAQHVGMTSFRENDESGLTRILWQPALRYSLDALAERILQDVRSAASSAS